MPAAPFTPQPFYCEENAWRIAGDPALGAGERLVLVLSGSGGRVACWNQRAGAGAPVLWDYHVVVAVRGAAWAIHDPDCLLGAPLPLAAWCDATFPHPVPAALAPRFLVLRAERYRRLLKSDREHMRDATGAWLQPPPPWPPPSGCVLLTTLILRARRGVPLAALRAQLAG